MIYVLSSDRRATVHWATEQSIPLTQVKHVQNVGSLPGVLAGDGKNRIVKLDSYAQRRDHWAIDAKLKILLRRGQIEIEEWNRRDDSVGDHYQNIGDPVPEQPEFDTPGWLQVAEPPVEVTKEVDGGELSVGGALPAAPKRDDVAVNLAKDLLAKQVDEPAPKPKRVRRTNAQIAYDKALADWETNGGTTDEVTIARRKLKADDPRLLKPAPGSVEINIDTGEELDF